MQAGQHLLRYGLKRIKTLETFDYQHLQGAT